MADDDSINLATEEEEEDVPYVEFDISVSPSDPPLELLVDQINRGDLIIPFYQRRYVWKIEQASKLIESFLMGLPVPQVFFYINDDNKLEVIDGQQRIMSVKYFFEELFGEPDNRDRRQVFKLKGLSERSEYNGKKFSELSDRDKRRLCNATLRAINIKQLKPSSRSDSVFHIFERLNTGGTQLKPQEIRNAVYRGRIVDELMELNENQNWHQVLGIEKPHRSQKDVELILRLFALYEVWENYEKPMLSYLNTKMSENRDFDSEQAQRFKNRFPEVVDIVNQTLEKPFRPRNVLNSAVLEAVMITLLENTEIAIDQVNQRYEELLQNEEFLNFVRGPTTDTQILRNRLRVAKDVFTYAET